MKKIYPQKLKKGDLVAIIAPATSLAIISKENRAVADARFKKLGLRLWFAKRVEEKDHWESSTVETRIEDLHEAFTNTEVKGIFSVIGGFNSNQLLRYIDWKLIQKNPKVFCGYSDISALNNAIFAKTGLVNYSGPAYSTFGQKLYFDYTLDYVVKCLFSDKPFTVDTSSAWTDDAWYLNQKNRHPIPNSGLKIIHEGATEGTIIGANLCTFNLLQGTEYMPSPKNTILFLEDDDASTPKLFDRDLQSLIHQPGFEGVRGIIIGRFQKKSNFTPELMKEMIESKKELNEMPVIFDADFGHTSPMFTFPIGGTAKIKAERGKTSIEIFAR